MHKETGENYCFKCTSCHSFPVSYEYHKKSQYYMILLWWNCLLNPGKKNLLSNWEWNQEVNVKFTQTNDPLKTIFSFPP